MVKAGKNQSYARYKNNELVLNLLKKKELSASELAGMLSLSNAALSQIMAELEERNLIRTADVPAGNQLGRKPHYYTLNGDYGLIVAVGFSDNGIHIAFANFKGEILEELRIRDVLNYDVTILYETILRIREIYDRNFRTLPLLSVNLSVPGKINNRTMEVAASAQFKNVVGEDRRNILKIFGSHFDVPVRIYNDINLSLIAEQDSSLESYGNLILIHIDAGVGGAFYLNNKIYGGDHGFAGELGFMPVVLDGKKTILDSAVSFTSVAERLSARRGRPYDIAALKELYYTATEVRDEFLRTAGIVGDAVRELADILDIGYVIVSGGVTEFDEEYKESLTAAINARGNNIEVRFSGLKDACVKGALITAVKEEILAAISKG